MNLSEIVTVVIPTIEERAELLQEAIESAQNQSVGSPAVLVGLDSERNGPAWMRNRLMEEVTTPFVLFLDDDDILHEDYFESVLPFFDDNDVIYTWCMKEGWRADNLNHDWNPDVMPQGNQVPVTACVRVEKFHEAGGFPENAVYEDWGLWLRMMDKGARFKCLCEFKWTYRRHGGSRTHQQQVKASQGHPQTG